MRVPLVLLAGVDPAPMASTLVALQFDLPSAVAVRHHIDVERQVLIRTVSDINGVLEEHETLLAHACVPCAVREDILPTLERLARDGRWQSIVAHLPVGAQPANVCHALAGDHRLARFLRVSAVVTAVGATRPVHDLLGDDLLADHGHHCSHEDRRGVGEVLAAMIEYADIAVFDEDPDPVADGLVTALARPDATVVTGSHDIVAAALVGHRHQHVRTNEWTSPTRREALCPIDAEGIWRLDLQSLQPFHPERLMQSLEVLGAGSHRSRGCFWLPTRPDRAHQWDGAGGQVSIGDHAAWGRRTPFTRIVVVGVGVPSDRLRSGFDELLLRPAEHTAQHWTVAEDGFEPWLGPIRRVA